MSTKSSINYKGFDFDFEYNHYKGLPATWDDPEEFEEFEIYNITLNGIDAEELLENEIERFESEIIAHLKE